MRNINTIPEQQGPGVKCYGSAPCFWADRAFRTFCCADNDTEAFTDLRLMTPWICRYIVTGRDKQFSALAHYLSLLNCAGTHAIRVHKTAALYPYDRQGARSVTFWIGDLKTIVIWPLAAGSIPNCRTGGMYRFFTIL